MPAGPRPTGVPRIALGLLKTIAIVAGFPLTVLAVMVRSDPGLAEAPPSPAVAPEERGRPQREHRPLLVVKRSMRRFDQRQAVEPLGKLAFAFPAAQLRLSLAQGTRKAKEVVIEATSRFAVAEPARIEAIRRRGGPTVQIEVRRAL